MSDKYSAGEDDTEALATGLLTDLKALGSPKEIRADLHALVETLKGKGKLVDDKQLVMEQLIGIVASLPNTSNARKTLTHSMIDGLWNSLQHPPLSYLGSQYQYRTADGSNNVSNSANPILSHELIDEESSVSEIRCCRNPIREDYKTRNKTARCSTRSWSPL